MKNSSLLLLTGLLFVLFACNNSSSTDNTIAVDSTDTRAENLNPPAEQVFTGTYTNGDWEIVEKLAGGEGEDDDAGGGYLAIEQKGADSLKFELTLFNGAPNYHTGTAEGMLHLKDNVATFETEEFDSKCKITFTFSGDEVKVDQVDGNDFDCGFGQGVMAFGTYKRRKNEAIFKYEGGFK